MVKQIHPETLYYAKRVARSGHQSVYKRLLPDGESTELSPNASLKLRDHSPTGFEFGYAGSGPAQLALAILLDVTVNPELSLSHYQDFKLNVVAQWGEEWEITSTEILWWLGTLQRAELGVKVTASRN